MGRSRQQITRRLSAPTAEIQQTVMGGNSQILQGQLMEPRRPTDAKGS
jgi:hypothetical protein